MHPIKGFKKWYAWQEGVHQRGIQRNKDRMHELQNKRRGITSHKECPKCGSTDIDYSFQDIRHNRSAVVRTAGFAGKAVFATSTFGLSLFLPTGKRTDTFQVATCKKCGNTWVNDTAKLI